MGRSAVRYLAFLCALLLLLGIGGVFAAWYYADPVEPVMVRIQAGINGFVYYQEPMPDHEVSIVQRLDDVLNKRYTTDTITDSLAYLVDNTIRMGWMPNDPPSFVGSMDQVYDEELKQLFGDVMLDDVWFIIKKEDLNWDGYEEFALYTTSDQPTKTSKYAQGGVLCVYVTVFTPVFDAQYNVTGYVMVCDSLRGYSPEVRYAEEVLIPSFSTTDWRDDIGYWTWSETQGDYIERVPLDAMSNDGTKPFRYDYDSYNRYYGWSATSPYGNTMSQCLAGKFP